MKISDYINHHSAQIIDEWETFARTLLPAAQGLPASELREPATRILQEIVLEIEAHRDHGIRVRPMAAGLQLAVVEDSAAAAHGALREVSGFTLLQVIAEYRALRTSVLRMWLPQVRALALQAPTEMLYFNEAVDKALAEASAMYARQAACVREATLMSLEHDLKTPLIAMAMSGDYLTRPGIGTQLTAGVGDRIKRSIAMMTPLVDTLLQYARQQQGTPGELSAMAHPADLTPCCLQLSKDVELPSQDCMINLDL